MSPRRHSWTAVVGCVAMCALLSGCFGSGGQEPTSGHRTHHSRATGATSPTGPTSPTESTSTIGTSPPPTTAPASSVLAFSPKSGDKHTNDCETLTPGDDPAEFVYYPLLVKASSPVGIEAITTQHSAGVTVAGAWVAPAAPTPATGTIQGWPPPKIFTQSSSIQWSKRVVAAGAQLLPGGWYNVFLRLQVDPTPGDSTMRGVVIRFHDAEATQTVTWASNVTFSMSC